MGALLDPPQPSSMTTPQGKISTPFYTWLRSLKDNVAGAIEGVGVVQSAQEVIDVSIEYPQNKDYPVEIDAPYGYAIAQVDSYCAAGSCTATVKIGSTPLGGGANSVSTTKQSVSHTSANVVAVGDTTLVAISANSSCNLLRLVYRITRT